MVQLARSNMLLHRSGLGYDRFILQDHSNLLLVISPESIFLFDDYRVCQRIPVNSSLERLCKLFHVFEYPFLIIINWLLLAILSQVYLVSVGDYLSELNFHMF